MPKGRRSQEGAASESANSLGDFAYSEVRAAIANGRYAAGQRMREAEIAEWLGLSRTPVRDALRRLESDSLLVSGPRRGLVVAELDQQQVSELYEVRKVLAGLAGRLSARQATAAEITAMRNLVQNEAETTDIRRLLKLNRLLHEVIYRSARNRYLSDVLSGFETSLALLPGSTYLAPQRPKMALEQHSGIVEAIARHDADAAQGLSIAHMQAAEEIRQLMLADGATASPDRNDDGSGWRPRDTRAAPSVSKSASRSRMTRKTRR